MRLATLKQFDSGEYKYVYIYYKQGKSMIRINTKNKVIHGGMQKDLLYNAKVIGRKEKNETTLRMLRNVNIYIQAKLELNQIPKQKECLRYLNNQLNIYTDLEYPKKYGKSFMEYYDEFFDHKKLTVKSKYSLKDYTSLKNALNDYQIYKNEALTFDTINTQTFLPEFNKYLLKVKKQADNTINKRVQCFKAFMNYIEEEDVFTFKKSASKFKVGKTPSTHIALSTGDLMLLKNLDLESNKEQKILDLFILNCFLAMSYSDLRKFDTSNIQNKDGNLVYIYKRSKSRVECVVPLKKTALEILEKYDNKIYIPSEQYFNRTVKKILKDKELFEEDVKVIRVVNGRDVDDIKLRRDMVSSHTCRRTYITRAIQAGVPINVIQKVSGHKLVTTINKYAKPAEDYEAFNAMEL